MTTETKPESQVREPDAVPPPGAEKRQVAEPETKPEPGAAIGAGKQVPSEAPTAEQLAELRRTIEALKAGESTRDEENTRLRTALQREALQREQALAELTEHRASQADRKMVDAGEMTEEEARSRAERRQESARAEQEASRRLAQARAQAAVFEQRNESAARQQLADTLARELGLDSKELLSRPEKGPYEMEIAALKMALERERETRPGTETYETNAGGPPGPPDLSGRSPLQQAVIAYGNEETARRQRNRR